MLELFLSQSIPLVATAYPNSGPGSIYLTAGNSEIGYFGRVTSAELMTYVAYRTHLTATAWTTGTDKGWLKFMYKGKVLFLSQGWIFKATWNQLYAAGGVYGVDGPGTYPATTPVNQYKPVVITQGDKTWSMIPRAAYVSAADPMPLGSPVTDNEFYDLLFRCCSVEVAPVFGQFDSLTKAELGLDTVAMGVATLSTNTTRALVLGYPSGNGWGSYQALAKTDPSGYNQAFRAVLQVEGDPTTPV